MGKVKEMMMEFEDSNEFMCDFLSFVKNIKCVDTNSVQDKLEYLISFIINSHHDSSLDERLFSVSRVNNILQEAFQQLEQLLKSCDLLNRDNKCTMDNSLVSSSREKLKIDICNSSCKEIEQVLFRLNYKLDSVIKELTGEDRYRILSSKDFYEKQIQDAQRRIEEGNKQQQLLINKLNELNKNAVNKDQEIEATKKELNDVVALLENERDELLKFRKEDKEREKHEKTVQDWNSKITKVFKDLEICIDPVKDEHKKLQYLFCIYNSLSVLVIIFLSVMEVCIYCKVNETKGFPSFEGYLALVTPIPVAIGLLWGFITQANRAQLQMVALAKQIHQITYIEGLLKAINGLSVDLKESIKDINDAIGKLLNKHLRDKTSDNEWADCVKNDPKVIPYDTLFKLIKEVKDIVK